MVAQTPQAYPEALRNLAFFHPGFADLAEVPAQWISYKTQSHHTHTHTHTHTHAHTHTRTHAPALFLSNIPPGIGHEGDACREEANLWKVGDYTYSEGEFSGKNCSPYLHKSELA